jgi:hypothetical protein
LTQPTNAPVSGYGGAGHHFEHGAAVEFEGRGGALAVRVALSLGSKALRSRTILCRHAFLCFEIFFDVGPGRRSPRGGSGSMAKTCSDISRPRDAPKESKTQKKVVRRTW